MPRQVTLQRRSTVEPLADKMVASTLASCCRVPRQVNCVFPVFNFSLFADIHIHSPTSSTLICTRVNVAAEFSARVFTPLTRFIVTDWLCLLCTRRRFPANNVLESYTIQVYDGNEFKSRSHPSLMLLRIFRTLEKKRKMLFGSRHASNATTAVQFLRAISHSLAVHTDAFNVATM